LKSICLIPAKGLSTRLPKKNLEKIGGTPLVGLAIQKARNCNIFDEVIVSTEDTEIAKISKIFGAVVPSLRPNKLSIDPATIVDVMLHVFETADFVAQNADSVTILLPTSPLVQIDDIIEANQLFDKHSGCTVLSVCETDFPPFNAWLLTEKKELSPCFPDSEYKFTKSTECPKTYRSNGAIMVCNVDSFLKNKSYRTDTIIPYLMPKERSIDIDTLLDLEIARFLMSN